MTGRIRVHRRRAVAASLTSLLLLACVAASAAAQAPGLRAAAGARIEGYSFRSPDKVDLDRVVLFTVPVSAAVSLTRRVEFGVSGAFAQAELTRADGREYSLSGLTDTELRVTTALADDRVRLGVVALVPTGQEKLTAEEMDVAGVIAADLLPFAISHWGAGGGLGANIAVAIPVAYDMALGVSAGYVVAREFEPVAAESFAYRPGNQLQLRAAVDRSFGAAGKGSLQLIYQQFAHDRTGGSNLYQAGDRLQAVASYAFAAGALGSGVAYLGYLRRQEGSYTEVVQLTPAQDLVYAGTGLRLPLGRAVLQPSVDLRVLGNADGLEQGYALTAGTAVELPVGGVHLIPLARARLGSLTVRQGLSSGYGGAEIGLSVRSGRRAP
jgi:hypothetical protein